MSGQTGLRGWFRPTRPTVAIEIASRRVTVASVSGVPGRAVIGAFASEELPAGVLTPALTERNIAGGDEVRAALRRALDRAGLKSVRRAALVVPDSLARVSFVELAEVPSRAGDLDRLLRWQLRKSLPFPVADARLSHFVAHAEPGRTTLAVVLARQEVVAEYEAVAAALDIHVGLVDLASFNVASAILSTGVPAGDSLLVCLAPDATTLLVLRRDHLMFYRHRAAAGDESIGALVHQTAMFHVDRLGGGRFDRVWLAGGAAHPADGGAFRAEIEARLGVLVEPVDVRPLASLRRGTLAPLDADALVAPIGAILRGAKAA